MTKWSFPRISSAIKRQEREQKEELSKVNKVLKQQHTRKKLIKDFPAIHKYLTTRFTDVDLSKVPIYLVSNQAMNNAGYQECNGCYYPAFDLILVKKTPSICEGRSPRGKYAKSLRKAVQCALSVDDIVVHECLHAISKKTNRAARFFTKAEEEFVFTNSIDFYKQKGMSEDRIINECFISFCINNIVTSRKHMYRIFLELKEQEGLDITPVEKTYTEQEYDKFINKHGVALVAVIVKQAQTEAAKMVECYKSNQNVTTKGDFGLSEPSGRFSGIRFRGG